MSQPTMPPSPAAKAVAINPQWDSQRAFGLLLKVLAGLGLIGNGLQALKDKDYQTAVNMFSAALALAGVAIKLHTNEKTSEAAALVGFDAARIGINNAATLREVVAGVDDIRSNPLMPGTPPTTVKPLDPGTSGKAPH